MDIKKKFSPIAMPLFYLHLVKLMHRDQDISNNMFNQVATMYVHTEELYVSLFLKYFPSICKWLNILP